MTQKKRVPACRTRRLTHRVVTGIVLALAAVTVLAAPEKKTLLNKPAPTFSRASLENGRVDLAGLRGRVVLLNFWATWCAPCQIEMPRFVQWQQKYQADGLSIVGVSMDDHSQPVKAFLQKRHLNYPVIMGDDKLGLAYGGVLGLPVTYLIDRKGIVRARYQGATDLAAMERVIQQLLKRP